MHFNLIWLALVSAAAPESKSVSSPNWQTSYGHAQRQGKSDNKPLAVFLAPGKQNWKGVTKQGSLTDETLKSLAANYICVHIDTTTEEGKKWARAFDMSSGLGVVLSDRSGENQAYRHEGSLDTSALASTIESHSGKSITRISNYPSDSIGRPVQGRIEYGSYPRVSRSDCPT